MIFALVRHGQTVWNIENRLQGRDNSPLTALGRQQAEAAGSALSELADWDVLVCSPLGRTRQTAAIVGSKIGLSVDRTLPDLVERSYGQAEGLTPAEAVRRWPAAVELDAADGSAHVDDTGVPDVEPRDAVAARGARALDELASEYPGQLVVVVAHGTIIRETISALVGRRIPRVLNGQVLVVDHDDHGTRLLSADELKGLGTSRPNRSAVPDV